jgi:phosphoglycerate dehydrogenase-like enzyme
MKIILPLELEATIAPYLSNAVDVVWADPDGNLDGDASDAEVYFINFYLDLDAFRRVLSAAPALRWQHAPSAGVEHLFIPEFLERDTILTNSAGVFAIPIAEFVLGLMLNHAKQLPDLKAHQMQRQWYREAAFQELMDKRLLIIGAGGIGQAIATRASAFGMQVWGSRRRVEPLPGFDQVVGAMEWRSLLPEADYVVIATPLTPETRGMIDKDALRSMRSNAYLINIARGAIVDEAALITALSESWIAGAALDTFSTEPLPAASPLWSLPNVVVTAHCSGESPRNIDRIVALFFENLQRYQQGLPLKNVVNRQQGY